jgi:hypothetical protein
MRASGVFFVGNYAMGTKPAIAADEYHFSDIDLISADAHDH